ncbi:flagellar basal body-associated FliL family protein [Melaminivora alkalimesophila]|uniref:Flagellar protein FliL n=1 Tax=Melaminivora alkalimesophila TaxID=1165852 RepID=A0A317RAW6_9BURK|nr:flagellar basal body-associated FliL family protein [Melaminivora alkalimesophila]PWW44465.1 flagellar FliL protein [Melaminivora alkalimesophila]
MSENAPAPAKSKKLVLLAAAVLLVVLVGGAAAWFLASQRQAALDDEDADQAPRRPAASAAAKAPPTFLPMENMVVNLADPGGDRFAQIGITLELADAKTADQVKAYMPSIRSGVLLLVSQRTTDDLLTREGKEQLAQDIRLEVARPLGYTVPKPRKRPSRRDDDDGDDDDEPPRRRADDNPVRQVHFSSFIIQ